MAREGVELYLYLARFTDLLFQILIFAIIGRALLSWFNVGPDHPIGRILYQLTEPILGPMRRVIPMIGMIDISPIVAIFLLGFIQGQVVNALIGAAYY